MRRPSHPDPLRRTDCDAAADRERAAPAATTSTFTCNPGSMPPSSFATERCCRTGLSPPPSTPASRALSSIRRFRGCWAQLLTLVFPIAAVPAIYTFIALAAAGLAMHRLAQPLRCAECCSSRLGRSTSSTLTCCSPLSSARRMRSCSRRRGCRCCCSRCCESGQRFAVSRCRCAAVADECSRGRDGQLYAGRGRDRSRGVIASRRQDEARGATDVCADVSWRCARWGLRLAAFYLVPAAYERRFVQIAMAIIPNMRFQDNFLFGHTGDVPHDVVLHTASLIAVTLLFAASAALVALHLNTRRTCAEDCLGIPLRACA